MTSPAVMGACEGCRTKDAVIAALQQALAARAPQPPLHPPIPGVRTTGWDPSKCPSNTRHQGVRDRPIDRGHR